MASIVELPQFVDARGSLTVLEKILPFEIKRVFWMYGIHADRGGHRHKKTKMALVAVSGSCRVIVKNGQIQNFFLDSPQKLLLLEPADWHQMTQFTPNAVLLVLASEYYCQDDYIYTPVEEAV